MDVIQGPDVTEWHREMTERLFLVLLLVLVLVRFQIFSVFPSIVTADLNSTCLAVSDPPLEQPKIINFDEKQTQVDVSKISKFLEHIFPGLVEGFDNFRLQNQILHQKLCT